MNKKRFAVLGFVSFRNHLGEGGGGGGGRGGGKREGMFFPSCEIIGFEKTQLQ